MAAAMESSTSSVRTCTSSVPPLMGVMRIPARAANAAPSAHEKTASLSGRPPFNWSSAGLSTTARMATPVRVLLKSIRMPTAMSTPQPEGDGLVVGDIDAEDLELRGVAEEQLVGPGDAGVPDPRSQGDQPEHDPDGDDDLGHLGRLAQPAHDAAVEDGPDQWGQDHDHDEQGERSRPVPAVAELPIGEGGEHGHRPLGEVEDARRGVRQDKARCGDPVDRARDQAENGVLEKEVHGRNSRPLRSPDGRSGAASAHPWGLMTVDVAYCVE